MREPLFSGETWEMRDSPGSRSCAPSSNSREGGESPWGHLAWTGGEASAGLVVKLHLKHFHCGSSWFPL